MDTELRRCSIYIKVNERKRLIAVAASFDLFLLTPGTTNSSAILIPKHCAACSSKSRFTARRTTAIGAIDEIGGRGKTFVSGSFWADYCLLNKYHYLSTVNCLVRLLWIIILSFGGQFSHLLLIETHHPALYFTCSVSDSYQA